MMQHGRRWIVVVGLLVFGLPLAGKWLRGNPGPRCALDGVRINPLYRVRIVDEQGRDRVFCCVECADLWLSKQRTRPRDIFVTDEETGTETRATSAWFVRSLEPTQPGTEHRIHTFRRLADAEKYAAAAAGSVLRDGDKPLEVTSDSGVTSDE